MEKIKRTHDCTEVIYHCNSCSKVCEGNRDDNFQKIPREEFETSYTNHMVEKMAEQLKKVAEEYYLKGRIDMEIDITPYKIDLNEWDSEYYKWFKQLSDEKKTIAEGMNWWRDKIIDYKKKNNI